jgi:hypothetical protein
MPEDLAAVFNDVGGGPVVTTTYRSAAALTQLDEAPPGGRCPL